MEQQGRYSGLRVVQVVGEKLSGSVQRLQAPLIKYSRSSFACVCLCDSLIFVFAVRKSPAHSGK